MKTKFLTLLLLSTFALFAMKKVVHEHKINIDTKASKIEWKSEKVVGSHNGTVHFKSGTIHLNHDNQLVGGHFVADLNTIKNLDLENKQYRAKLETHLKSADFFNVEKFQTAELKIKKSTPTKDLKYQVVADLTIKGITHEIEFPAEMAVENNAVTAKADFKIDRTKWDIMYNSKKSGVSLEELGDNMIYDDIEFTVKLSALIQEHKHN